MARGEDVPAWRYIAVDQFGYRPEMKKVAVLVDPEDGFNGNDQFTPGNTYEVRRWSDAKVVFSGKPTPWNDGQGAEECRRSRLVVRFLFGDRARLVLRLRRR